MEFPGKGPYRKECGPTSYPTTIMSEKLNQCCNRLKQELQTAEAHLKQAGDHLATVTETEVDALETRLKTAVAKCEAKREQATQAGQRLKQLMEEAKQNALAPLEDWKTDREIAKLEKHAVRTARGATAHTGQPSP